MGADSEAAFEVTARGSLGGKAAGLAGEAVGDAGGGGASWVLDCVGETTDSDAMYSPTFRSTS